MKKQKSGKKDDEDLETIIANLKVDVEVLEHDIYLEELRDEQAKNDYEKLLKLTYEEQGQIDHLKEDKDLEIKLKSEKLSEEETKMANEITSKKERISTLETEIQKLICEIKEDKEKHEEILKKHDENIKIQESLFQQMTSKFQNILENTASKLQEKVKMGS